MICFGVYHKSRVRYKYKFLLLIFQKKFPKKFFSYHKLTDGGQHVHLTGVVVFFGQVGVGGWVLIFAGNKDAFLFWVG